jgi:glycosyltransferase involved in cell wall biosynthesis
VEWSERWAAADVFVLPTRNDARPNALQEAAVAGLPAIATRITSLPEIVTHGETGLLVPAGDTAALAEALERLIASPALRDALGRRARAFILEVAAPDRYLSMLIDLVLTVAKTR